MENLLMLVVGIGNPGENYKFTRHNIGFRVLDRFAKKLSVEFKYSKELNSEIIKKGNFVLIKPHTFVNLSGIATSSAVSKYSISIQNLLVVCDDFSLLLGKLKLKLKGSSGGHKGLESIIKELGTEEFPRLRLGIGPVPEGVDPKEFVLSKFESSEEKIVEEMIEKAVQSIEKIIEIGIEKTMEFVNRKNE
ncbi:MAG: aminoacyl-tRNA hydrolase [Endomicrobiia bacterium]